MSIRGTRHLEELSYAIQEGCRAAVFFCVQRNDIREFRPADEIDPEFGRKLREVMDAGVEVFAYKAAVSTACVVLESQLPLLIR